MKYFILILIIILIIFFIIEKKIDNFKINNNDNNNDNNNNLILIHLGNSFPFYIFDCIHQFRIFNNDINLYLLVEEENYNLLQDLYISYIISYNIRIVNINKLNKTQKHINFNKESNLDKNFRNGFWHYAAERFFVLEDFVTDNNIENIFHIEYDNLIYYDINKILNIIRKHYKDSAGIFDNDTQCIASFIYFKNVRSLDSLTNYIYLNQKNHSNEMNLLSSYRKDNINMIEHLPILTEKYLFNEIDLIYSNKQEYFNLVFDGRAIGQYVGGVDPKNDSSDTEGFINTDVIFNVSKLNFMWKNVDNLLIPYACDVPVVNLHIHCKNLLKWSSDRISKFNINEIITGERLENLFKKYNLGYIETHSINNELDKINKNNMILLTHNSDDEIGIKYKDILDSNKIKYWFAQNTNTKHPKLINVPIGLANSKWGHGNLEIFNKYMLSNNKKENLCYFGFNCGTYPILRNNVKTIIEKTCPSFIFYDNLSFEEYLDKLSKSKYCICPRGNGLDTHRLWECLYLKVVPLVDRNCVSEYHQNLGIVIIDDWNTVTEDFLNSKYNEFYKKLNIPTMSFYENIIKNLINMY
jgi:hypothetical protein